MTLHTGPSVNMFVEGWASKRARDARVMVVKDCLHVVFSSSLEKYVLRIWLLLRACLRAFWDTSWRKIMSWGCCLVMNERISVTRSWVCSDRASMFHVNRDISVLLGWWVGSGSVVFTGSHCLEVGLNWCQNWNFGGEGGLLGRGVLCFQDAMVDDSWA